MKHKNKHRKTHETMYYLLLLVLVLFIAGCAFLLLPLILVATPIVVYIITFILGGVFGVFLIYFIKDLDVLTHHHHAGIWFVVLVSSIINFLSIFIITAEFRNFTGIHYLANPFLTAIIFSAGFLLPYYISLFNEKHKGASLWMK